MGFIGKYTSDETVTFPTFPDQLSYNGHVYIGDRQTVSSADSDFKSSVAAMQFWFVFIYFFPYGSYFRKSLPICYLHMVVVSKNVFLC